MTDGWFLPLLLLGIFACLGTSVFLVWRNIHSSLLGIHDLTNSTFQETRQELAEVRARLEASLAVIENLRLALTQMAEGRLPQSPKTEERGQP
jgi:hypothetical protein